MLALQTPETDMICIFYHPNIPGIKHRDVHLSYLRRLSTPLPGLKGPSEVSRSWQLACVAGNDSLIVP